MPTKFKTVAHRILIKIADPDDIYDTPEALKKLGFKTAHGLGEEQFAKVATDKGTVVAIGPMAWKLPHFGYGSPEWQPWCKVGDEVVFGKYAGKLIKHPDTKEEFMIINDDDIQMVLEKED